MYDVAALEREFGDLSPYQHGPEFWTATPRQAQPLMDSLNEATLRTIGRSAGGRDIIAIEYGEFEPLDATMNNLHSALASTIANPDPTAIFPPAFYGSKRRTKPVLAIQGGIHGGELTGTVATLNLCRVIETGSDLRGKPWPKLQELARETRLALVPWLNIDGVERCPIPCHAGVPADLYDRATFGVTKDGEALQYMAMKRMFPISPENMAFMGTYFNDAGVNLQYDFCLPHRQPETVAWMEYYLAEKPDAVLIWHCNAGSMLGPSEAYLPEGTQREVDRLAGAVRHRLLRDGFNIGRVSWAGLAGMGTPYLNQMNAVYHTAGATPVMCELPAGSSILPMTADEMLDIGLITIEEVLFYAHTDGLRPYELWTKVKKQMRKAG